MTDERPEDDLPPDTALPAETAAEHVCATCRKIDALCVCDGMEPIDNRLHVLILQHPQEQDKSLGTARLTAAHLKQAEVKVGLSWPSLAKVLGRPADPEKWAVLYLGSAKAEEIAPGRDVVALTAKGTAKADQDATLAGLEGVIVLDGTWSQAKALWWRNPWVLKCQRVILNPRQPSRYGKLRYEPRRDSLSTLESVGLLLSRLENRPEIETALTASFQRLLDRYKALPREETGDRPKSTRPHPGRRHRPASGGRGQRRARGRV